MKKTNLATAPAATSETATEGRIKKRATVVIACEVRQSLAAWAPATMRDLSCEGFQLYGLARPDPGLPIRIRIPGKQVFSARVCWVRGRAIGCAFATPLHDAVLAHMLEQHARG